MRSGLNLVNSNLAKKTYQRQALVSEIGGDIRSGSVLSSGRTLGDGVIDPATQRLIPPAEQEQSRNTRGPYFDRGSRWLDIFDQYEGWKRVRLDDATLTGDQAGISASLAYEAFQVTVAGMTDFSLDKIPTQNSEIVTLNGVILRYGSSNDYTIIDNVVKFNPLWNLQLSDFVAVRYSPKE